jgi:hypothetical protein
MRLFSRILFVGTSVSFGAVGFLSWNVWTGHNQFIFEETIRSLAKIQKPFTNIELEFDSAQGNLRDGLMTMKNIVCRNDLKKNQTERKNENKKTLFNLKLGEASIHFDWKFDLIRQWRESKTKNQEMDFIIEDLKLKNVEGQITLLNEKEDSNSLSITKIKTSKSKGELIGVIFNKIKIENVSLNVNDERIINKKFLQKKETIQLPTASLDFLENSFPLRTKKLMCDLLFNCSMKARIANRNLQVLHSQNRSTFVWQINDVRLKPFTRFLLLYRCCLFIIYFCCLFVLRTYLAPPLGYVEDGEVLVNVDGFRQGKDDYLLNVKMKIANIKLNMENEINKKSQTNVVGDVGTLGLLAYFAGNKRIDMNFNFKVSDKDFNSETLPEVLLTQLLIQAAWENRERLEQATNLILRKVDQMMK